MAKMMHQDLENNREIIENITKVVEKYKEILMHLMYSNIHNAFKPTNTKLMQDILSKSFNSVALNPERFININLEYSTKFTELVTNSFAKLAGSDVSALYTPSKRDKRFRDSAWNDNVYFDFIKQFYLMSSEWMQRQVAELNLETRMQRYVEFYTRQLIDAYCPSNVPFCNPEVVRMTVNTKWRGMVDGLDNLLHDLKKSDSSFYINTADKMAFKVGKNIASTSGKIVMQNDLIQLICYEPKQAVHKIPILIIPPCINKYYILDLSPENSLVKHLVTENFQVFLVSWVNPDESLSHKTFDDYINEGIVDSCRYICNDLGFKNISAVGYCIGGTMLAIAIAYMKAKNMDYVKSATYFTTMLDFADSGEIGLFINEDTIAAIESVTEKVGYLDGRYIANSFSILRANDLIWSFFVNNYLLGRRPVPFDLLYWNSDPSNLPAAMNSFYLRKMYIENSIARFGRINISDTDINLSDVDIPSFFVGAKDDHIAPWRSVYTSARLVGGEKVFCLANSGHVAGIINPPSQGKYSYWTADIVDDPNEWSASSIEQSGSWWPYWIEWQKKYSGPIEDEAFYSNVDFIENAPGSYVLKKC